MTEPGRRPIVHVPKGFGTSRNFSRKFGGIFGHDIGRGFERSGPKFLDRNQFRELEKRRLRLNMIAGVFALTWIVLAGQLVNLTVFKNDAKARSVSVVTDVTHGEGRRNIVDRNAQLVATNLQTVTLFVDTRDILDPDEAALALMSVFPEFDFQELQVKLAPGRAWVLLRRDLTPRQHASVHALGIPAFRFEKHQRRIYPKGTLASHVVGFVGSDNNGLIGLEKTLDAELVSLTAKKPVELALDLRVQYVMRDELLSSMIEFKAKAAAGLVMDVSTGEILALVSLPDFDPNDFGSATSQQLFNSVTLGVYEMGSTFKAFNTAMALDGGKIKINDRFDATKPYQVANHTIRDFHPENRWLSVAEVFTASSNVGSARIAHKVGAQAQTEFLERLGLFDRSEIEIPEIGRPLLPVKWGPTETATVSYGHGISVSPLSLAAAISSLVNGGFKVEPTLLRRKDFDLATRDRVVKGKTSRQMRRLMRQVVTSGTASQADVPGYSVGGKTGSADKSSSGGYDGRELMTSFAGIFPSDNPRYLVLAILDEPQPGVNTSGYRTAGWNAAPTVAAIIKRSAPVLGVRPGSDVSPFAAQAKLANEEG